MVMAKSAMKEVVMIIQSITICKKTMAIQSITMKVVDMVKKIIVKYPEQITTMVMASAKMMKMSAIMKKMTISLVT